MIKNLILVRHGQAVHHIGNELTGGWTDSLLTAIGCEQAKKTALALNHMINNLNIDFYSSDLKRAVQTSQIICKNINISPICAPELREFNNGDAANLSRKEAEKIHIPITQPVLDWKPYPNGESWRMLNKRVFTFMNKIDKISNDTVLIVSHSGTIISIIHWWLEFNDNYITKISFDIDPCSITRLRVNKWGEKTIIKLNDTSHI